MVTTTHVGDQYPVGTQPCHQLLGRTGGRRDQHRAVGRHRRKGRARSLEQEQVGLALAGERRRPRSTFERNGAPARPPPHRRAPTVTTRASAASSRKSDAACWPARERSSRSSSAGARRGAVDELRAARARPAPSRRRTTPVALAQEAGQVAADGGLADPLPRADHRDRRARRPRPRRRPELEVGAASRRGRPRARRLISRKRVALAQHRLVGEVDDPPGARACGRPRPSPAAGIAPDVLERHAVVGLPAQLLGAAQEQRRHDVVRPPRLRRSPPAPRPGSARRRPARAPRRHRRPAAESCGGGECFS